VRAVILAAGVGRRLGAGADHPPKAALEFGGKSLIARHLEILRHLGVEQVTVATGYKSELLEREIARAGAGFASCVLNPAYRDGSIVSLWAARRALASGADILLMDADVLYDYRLLARLVESRHVNCFLMDRQIEPGDEPVKLCVREGQLVDFHKIVRNPCDYYGESVGFFRLSPPVASRLAARSESYVSGGRGGEWYEEALRDVLLESAPGTFGFEDITGLPWIEIDFPEDVARARDEILPRLAGVPRGGDK
jgi:choline kinase